LSCPRKVTAAQTGADFALEVGKSGVAHECRAQMLGPA